MNGRTYRWKGAWRATTRQVMRGMGLKPVQVRRLVAAKPSARVTPGRKAPAKHAIRAAPKTKTPTARKRVKPGS